MNIALRMMMRRHQRGGAGGVSAPKGEDPGSGNRMKDFFQGFKETIVSVYEDLPTAKQLGSIAVPVVIVLSMVGVVILVMWLSTRNIGTENQTSENKYVVWETYDGQNYNLYRMRTPEGWLVRCNGNTTYVPDAQHQWKIEVR